MSSHPSNPSGSGTSQFLPPDSVARQTYTNKNNKNGVGNGVFQQALPHRPLSAHELATEWRKSATSNPTDKTQDVIDAIVGTHSGAEAAARIGYQGKINPTHNPSGIVPDPEKKEYCTYWIRTGECDYAQQGCMYKHEMPDDEKLRALGFRKKPQWWQEKDRVVRPSSEKTTVGPIVRPAVWLKQAKGSDPDVGSDADESSAAGTSDGRSMSVASVCGEKTSKLDVKVDLSQSPSTLDKGKDPINTRKQSTTGDLIDLASLSPIAASSSTWNLLSAGGSGESSNGKVTLQVGCHDKPSVNKSIVTTSKAKKGATRTNIPQKLAATVDEIDTDHRAHQIFVPAGESAATHIVQASKKAGSRKRVDKTETADSLEQQIQAMQKAKHATAAAGLMSSKYAPTGARKRVAKTTTIKGVSSVPDAVEVAAAKASTGGSS